MISTQIDQQEIAQFIIFLIAIYGLYCEIIWTKRHPKKSYYSKPVSAIFIHNILYYIVLFSSNHIEFIHDLKVQYVPLLFTWWSTVRLMHMVIALASIARLRLYYDNYKRWDR